MSCFICGRVSCASWMHGASEQEKYAEAIDAFERTIDLRDRIRNEEDEGEEE